ncbi:hypothetical protein A7G45_18120 [Mycolicibacterium llatzerense]|nr:hypothetical protein [Mycolicibacterium llatzerense]
MVSSTATTAAHRLDEFVRTIRFKRRTAEWLRSGRLEQLIDAIGFIPDPRSAARLEHIRTHQHGDDAPVPGDRDLFPPLYAIELRRKGLARGARADRGHDKLYVHVQHQAISLRLSQ